MGNGNSGAVSSLKNPHVALSDKTCDCAKLLRLISDLLRCSYSEFCNKMLMLSDIFSPWSLRDRAGIAFFAIFWIQWWQISFLILKEM